MFDFALQEWKQKNSFKHFVRVIYSLSEPGWNINIGCLIDHSINQISISGRLIKLLTDWVDWLIWPLLNYRLIDLSINCFIDWFSPFIDWSIDLAMILYLDHWFINTLINWWLILWSIDDWSFDLLMIDPLIYWWLILWSIDDWSFDLLIIDPLIYWWLISWSIDDWSFDLLMIDPLIYWWLILWWLIL